jgi:hypothetical protein
MYSVFKIDHKNLDVLNNKYNYKYEGKTILKKNEVDYKNFIEKYILDRKKIDVNILEEEWFPDVDADIFISHSSNDIDLVYKIAGWLEKEVGVKVFIDSAFWNNTYDLLRIIDDKYCYNESSDTYNYQRRNYTTNNIFMILNVALVKMIDRLESVFFIKTPNSVNLDNGSTGSPWIYSEIIATQLIRKRKLIEYRKQILGEMRSFELSKVYNSLPEFEYKIPLDNIVEINNDDLNKWAKTYNYVNLRESKDYSHSLDILYKIKR